MHVSATTPCNGRERCAPLSNRSPLRLRRRPRPVTSIRPATSGQRPDGPAGRPAGRYAACRGWRPPQDLALHNCVWTGSTAAAAPLAPRPVMSLLVIDAARAVPIGPVAGLCGGSAAGSMSRSLSADAALITCSVGRNVFCESFRFDCATAQVNFEAQRGQRRIQLSARMNHLRSKFNCLRLHRRPPQMGPFIFHEQH